MSEPLGSTAPRPSPAPAPTQLPPIVERSLKVLVEAARAALGDTLVSVVLFGSGAEGQLRLTPDVNVIFVLRAFEAARLDPLREPLRTAQAAVRLAPMFLLERELDPALEAFAVKFADVLHRRRVLFGPDPFQGKGAVPPRAGAAAPVSAERRLALAARLPDAQPARGAGGARGGGGRRPAAHLRRRARRPGGPPILQPEVGAPPGGRFAPQRAPA